GRARSYRDSLAPGDAEKRSVTVLSAPSEADDCAGWRAGLAAIAADLFFLIDGDCLINRNFVAAHVFEHWWQDVDVVIGPIASASDHVEAAELIAALDAGLPSVATAAPWRDSLLPEGFLNCSIRNL